MQTAISPRRFARTLLLLASVIYVGVASASTVTFDAAGFQYRSAWSEAGYNVAWTGGNGFGYTVETNNCGPTCSDNGTFFAATTRTYSGGSDADTLVVTAANGGLFGLASFDGTEFPFNGSTNYTWASGIKVTGVHADNSTVSVNFSLDQINDGTGGVADFQNFSANLSGVFKQIEFTGIQGNGLDFGIDNLVLNEGNAVPEPGSLALIGLGLAGLAAARRRKQA